MISFDIFSQFFLFSVFFQLVASRMISSRCVLQCSASPETISIIMPELTDYSDLVVWWRLYQRMEVIKVVFVTGLVRNIHSPLCNSAITKNVAQLLAGAVKMTRLSPPSDHATALKFPVSAKSSSELLRVRETGWTHPTCEENHVPSPGCPSTCPGCWTRCCSPASPRSPSGREEAGYSRWDPAQRWTGGLA